MDAGTPDDPINYHIIIREIALASHRGYSVASYRIVIVDAQGKTIARLWATAKPLNQEGQDTRPSRLSDAATASIIRERIRLRHTTLSDLEVSSEEGLQSVTITMSAATVDAANVDVSAIVSSLRPLASYANEQGAHVVGCRVRLSDEAGNLLLNYIADFRVGFENWWAAPGLSSEWSPQPALAE